MSAKLWCLIQTSDGKIELQESLDEGKHWEQLKTPNGVFGAVVRLRTTVGVEKLAQKYGVDVENGIQFESRTDAVVLNCQHFAWNRNLFSRKFQDLKTAHDFVATFHALLETVAAAVGNGQDSNGEAADELPSAKRIKIGKDEAQDKKWLDKQIAPPLAVDTVLTAVQTMSWKTLGEMLLPRNKVDEIKQEYQSDDKRLRAVVEYWVQGDGRDKDPSWRRIIHELDCSNETGIADKIRHFADSVPDSTLTVEKVMEVMGQVGDWEGVGGWLDIPKSKLAEVKQQSSTEEEKSRALGEYWVNTTPGASWEKLAKTLYRKGEERAATMAKHYLPKDPTLTVEKVTEVIREVGDWEQLGGGLEVPKSKLAQIKQQSSTEGESHCALGEYWVNTDPDASWKWLAMALYRKGEKRAAAMAKQYLPKDDPTLTTDNIMEVVKEVEHRWEDLGRKLRGVQLSKLREIKRLYQSDHLRMEAMLDEYIKYIPTPNWKEVAIALQRMELHKLVDMVTTKYVRASEKSKELFEEAMAHGYVEARDIKALIFGAAGTGKSHTIALIMDEDPPTLRCSTPCATRPVRAVSRTRAEKRGNKFVRVTCDELSQTIADTSTMLPAKPSLVVNAKTSASSFTTPTVAGTSKPQTGHQQHTIVRPPPSLEASSITHENVSSISSSSEDELLRRIEMSPYARHAKKAFKRDRISLIDTGGQPQFHEVLPIFMRGTSATMFAIKLNENLGDHPLIEYFDDNGQRVGIPYRSAFTNEQILQHCMRVMQSQASQSEDGLCPNAIFIGTHKDLEDQCPESREEKNRKIHDMLLPAVQNDVIYFGEDLKELIFPLNAKYPGPQDQRIAAELRRVIVEISQVKPKRIPLRWYAFELALQKRMLELQQGVLSKAECFAVARRFHFNEESFEEALKYLDNLSILFYYRDVLPNIIFCDSQVLLDKITELVEHIHRLKTHPSQHRAVQGKIRKFRDQGIVTVELLSKPEFSKHYVPGLFGPVQLLKLFTKLLIVSQVTEEEYLMPCLLPVTEEPTLLCSSSNVPSLLFHFPNSPSIGVFCALVAYLLSRAKWKLLFDASGRSPAKVDRNTIEFEVPGDLPGSIILSDSFSTYFQVSIQLPPNIASELCQEVCPQIRETIVAGIRIALTTLHYNNVMAQDAFFCSGEHSSTDPPASHMHVATVASNRRWMTCTRNRKVCSKVTEHHLVWFPQISGACGAASSDEASLPNPMICNRSGSGDTTTDIGDLIDIGEYLVNLKKDQIFRLGLVLGLRAVPTLDIIKDSSTFLYDMLTAWVQGQDDVGRRGGHTWGALVKGLRHPSMAQTETADKIQREKLH